MRFGFVTAVRLGLGCLESIYEIDGEIDLLMTLDDAVAPDRSGSVSLDAFAETHAIPLHKVGNINEDSALAAIRGADLDWLFIIGWSQIARRAVLTSTTHGCIGMHPTLLPVGRGRASIPWAIIKRLPETGVTMFKLDKGVDTGSIIDQETVPIATDETATTLYTKIAESHGRLMARTFPKIVENEIKLEAQDDRLATTWPARTPEDGRIDLDMTVSQVDTLVRATTHPYPGAFVERPDGDILRIWRGSMVRSQGGIPLEAADGTYWAIETSGG